MKVLAGSFQCESNTFCGIKAKIQDFEIVRGNLVLEKLVGAKYLINQGFSVIPMIFASALPSGVVEKQSYLNILSEFLDIVKENSDADGIYLYLHGAMYVEELGSGEEYMIKQIREVVGEKTPISLAVDFHANNSESLVKNINTISGFRTAPHTDHDQTELRAVSALARIILNKLDVKTYMIKLPIMLADVAVTTKDPYRSIISMLEELDIRDDVLACSVFNGQPWVDADFMGGSVTASYYSEGTEVKRIVDKIAGTFWNRKNEFSFDVPSKTPDEALELAKSLKKPVYITDSGDNTTAGAEGKSTYFLGKIIKSKLKKVLVCGITCEELVKECYDKEIGSQISFEIKRTDIYSEDIKIKGILKVKGNVIGWSGEIAGKAVTLNVSEGIDVVFTNVRAAFISKEHIEEHIEKHIKEHFEEHIEEHIDKHFEEHIDKFNTRLDDYEYIILKMGYLFPKLKPMAASIIFALTPGTSTNSFSKLSYKNLKEKYFMLF